MQETLLFTTTGEMLTALGKIQAAFPSAHLFLEPRNDSESLPVKVNLQLDLGLIDERSWCEWAIEQDVFNCCCVLVLLSLDPPEWMSYLWQAHALKERAKKVAER
jgi:hypothetical protein